MAEPNRTVLVRWALAAMLAATAPACSFALTHGPPDGYTPSARNPRPPDCTADSSAPLIDLSIAVGAVAAMALTRECRGQELCFGPKLIQLGGALTLFGSLWSAAVGKSRTTRCSEAQRAHRQWLLEQHPDPHAR